MVVKSERTGERPETVEIAGADVWLRRGISEGEREEQGGEGGSVKVKVFTYEELHFTDPTGELTVEGAKADFDTVWGEHERDGMGDSEPSAPWSRPPPTTESGWRRSSRPWPNWET